VIVNLKKTVASIRNIWNSSCLIVRRRTESHRAVRSRSHGDLGVPLFAGGRCFFDARSELGLDHIRHGWIIYTSTFVARKNHFSLFAIFISPMRWGKRIKISIAPYMIEMLSFCQSKLHWSRILYEPRVLWPRLHGSRATVRLTQGIRVVNVSCIALCRVVTNRYYQASIICTTKRKMWYCGTLSLFLLFSRWCWCVQALAPLKRG
jgi:hypothetical protein